MKLYLILKLINIIFHKTYSNIESKWWKNIGGAKKKFQVANIYKLNGSRFIN